MKPESIIQRAIRTHLDTLGFRSVHVPNGAQLAGNGQQRAMQMNAMKRDGLMVGFPDLIVYGPNGRVGHIEVKVEGSKQADTQKAVEAWMRNWNQPYAICRSIADVDATLSEWGWV